MQPITRKLSIPLALGLATVVGLAAPTAEARPDRRGLQSDFLLGASGCIPGRAKCDADGEIAGKTGPHMGFGATLGFRPLKVLMVGAAYNLGFFNPDYARAGADVYRIAYQNSVFGVVRAILPIWRIDLGLEIGPGWSRQTFRATDKTIFTKSHSQGFAMKMGPIVDIFLTKRFFIGAKVDFIFNFHNQVCTDNPDSTRVCVRTSANDQAAVHQVIGGLHLGSVF